MLSSPQPRPIYHQPLARGSTLQASPLPSIFSHETHGISATNNIEVNTTWSAGSDSNSVQVPGTDVLSVEPNGLNPPPYGYTLDAASSVPSAVPFGAGAGKGPYSP